MKRSIIAFLVILSSCAGHPVKDSSGLRSIDDFKESLALSNNEMWGDLKRYGKPSDLGGLTYERYLTALKANPAPSVGKLVEEIGKAEEHRVVVEPDDFITCFRSEAVVYVVCDRASTPSLDRVWREKPLPSIEKAAAEMRVPK